jgi:hypothetical protein
MTSGTNGPLTIATAIYKWAKGQISRFSASRAEKPVANAEIRRYYRRRQCGE